ncbi:DUF1275 domain-containing protein [Paraburkholderia sp. JPY169]|uniref:DUF1275 domain-containing protein n=2 Tax=Paraburkholderia youngii TaxID=2782701 RepID=A0A7Y6MXJ9_9BURK|nr:DUF1275 domain-containing protein [Paraburkholderia youngii]
MKMESVKAHPAIAILLTLCGGFLDAFTFVGHGRIFANSMTGNIVVTAVSLAAENRGAALAHLVPLGGFAVGVFGAHLLRLAASRDESLSAIVALLLEAVFLFAAAIVGMPQLLLIPGISFVAALQTTIFTHSGTQPYSSVMTTGNLLRTLQGFFRSTIPRRDFAGIRSAAVLATICFCFACGATAGAVATQRFHDVALLGPSSLAFIALICLVALKTRNCRQEA